MAKQGGCKEASEGVAKVSASRLKKTTESSSPSLKKPQTGFERRNSQKLKPHKNPQILRNGQKNLSGEGDVLSAHRT